MKSYTDFNNWRRSEHKFWGRLRRQQRDRRDFFWFFVGVLLFAVIELSGFLDRFS